MSTWTFDYYNSSEMFIWSSSKGILLKKQKAQKVYNRASKCNNMMCKSEPVWFMGFHHQVFSFDHSFSKFLDPTPTLFVWISFLTQYSKKWVWVMKTENKFLMFSVFENWVSVAFL